MSYISHLNRNTEGSVSTISNLWTNSLHRHHPLTSDWYRNTSLEGAPSLYSSSASQVRIAAFPPGVPHRNGEQYRVNLTCHRSHNSSARPHSTKAGTMITGTTTTMGTATTTLSSSSSSSRLPRFNSRPSNLSTPQASSADNADTTYDHTCHTLEPSPEEISRNKRNGFNIAGLCYEKKHFRMDTSSSSGESREMRTVPSTLSI